VPGIMKDPRHRRTVWRYPLQVQVRKTQSGIGVRRSGLPTALAKLVLRVAVPFGCAGSSLLRTGSLLMTCSAVSCRQRRGNRMARTVETISRFRTRVATPLP
jgi:hypothetical protein